MTSILKTLAFQADPAVYENSARLKAAEKAGTYTAGRSTPNLLKKHHYTQGVDVIV